jgi:hypothetical protein
MHKTARWIFFGFALLLWLSTSGFVLFEGEGLLFFSLGILIQKTNFDIDKPGRGLNPLLWGIVFVGLSAGKTLLAFKGEPLLGNAIFPILSIMHKLVIISGLIAAWYGCNKLVAWCMEQKWFVWLSAFAFMIYALHAPLVAYATEAVFAVVSHLPYYRMLDFIFLPLAIISMSVAFGVFLRKIFPGVYFILTGGRGL